MKLLLDTHALLWWFDDDPRLGRQARDMIADPSNDIFASIVCLWEIVVKIRVGKMRHDVPAIVSAIARDQFALLGVATAHLESLVDLPRHHDDPFDHLLIAQAISEQAVIVTNDLAIFKYPVGCLPCGS